MKTVTERLVEFVGRLRFEDLPQKVKHEAKRILLDATGCALGGLAVEKGKLSVGLARRLGGPAEATVIGVGDKLACTNAAFANGELMNALDFDGTIAVSHSTPCILPAFMAVAEQTGARGRDLILATVIGHEIAGRLAKAMSGLMEIVPQGEGGEVEFPVVHGFSKAVFGAIAGAGKILGLGKEALHHAFGIGGTLAPVNHYPKWYNNPPAAMTKYAMPGWISQAGIQAAYLAQMGYAGIRNILDGEDGYWKYSGSARWVPEKVTTGLGKEWLILDVDYKPYPCCRIMHGGLDCFYRLLEENSLNPGEIKEVNLRLPPLGEKPVLLNRKIVTHIDAQFSVAYVFAVAAHRVALNLWQDRETVRDPRILKFMSKVHWTMHPLFAKEMIQDPHSRPSAVEVLTKDGRKFRKETKYFQGSSVPQGFALSDDQLADKFRMNAGRVLSARKIDEAVERIFEMEKVKRVDEMMACLSMV